MLLLKTTLQYAADREKVNCPATKYVLYTALQFHTRFETGAN